jgi:radical SAM protein (TIGR01212 family)
MLIVLNNMNKALYNDYGTWIRGKFPFRVQKISIDAGFSCPNRDGSIGRGGCIYCDNRTFNPAYCDRNRSIREQLEEGKRFFAHKYPDMRYLAYFQAFTNTYGSVESLKRMYEEALNVEDVVGIVIGTRPDCISEELLDYLEELNRQTFLIVETVLKLLTTTHCGESTEGTASNVPEKLSGKPPTGAS